MLATLLASSAWLCGCASSPTEGYAVGSSFRDDVGTVAVPIFTNRTFSRDIEFELTDAVIKELQRMTPYRIAGEARADTVLEGVITRVELDRLSQSRGTGLTEEGVVRVTIDFEWKDLRNGHTLLSREEFTGQALFVPSAPSREPIELGQFAVVQQMARDIVSEMRSDW
jgi:hypothetical protein